MTVRVVPCRSGGWLRCFRAMCWSDQRNEGRLNSFRDAITDSCEDMSLNIIHCPGVIDDRRGYGLTIAHMICFNKAIAMDQEVNFFFEDDVLYTTIGIKECEIAILFCL